MELKAKRKNREHIRHRGKEVARIEAFSDAVFAFAITLLIVSLEVPHNYEELMDNMKFFVPFGICFGIVYIIWYQQNMFFRRYGLHDQGTLILNGILLFLVLAYMFPLKFLFGIMFSKNKFHIDNAEQFTTLFCLYCGGFLAFYLLFSLMHFHAYRQRLTIGLSDMEAFRTKTKAFNFLAVSAVSVVAVAIAATGGRYASMAGMAYVGVWPLTTLISKRRDKVFKAKFGVHPDEVVVADEVHTPVHSN